MSNPLKDAMILQLTGLLIEQSKNIDEYTFQDCDTYNIYIIKNTGLKMIVNLLGFSLGDAVNRTYDWEQHKIRIIDIFDKLEMINDAIISAHKENEPVDILCRIEHYLSKSLLEHFVSQKECIRITNPMMFSSMDIYMLSFKDLEVFKKFIESKIFFKIKGIVY